MELNPKWTSDNVLINVQTGPDNEKIYVGGIHKL